MGPAAHTMHTCATCPQWLGMRGHSLATTIAAAEGLTLLDQAGRTCMPRKPTEINRIGKLHNNSHNTVARGLSALNLTQAPASMSCAL